MAAPFDLNDDSVVVVIGSGAGGLTAAAALARCGQRVLVLEQHYLPGGWMHSFTLDGYRFSPGVHYVGQCGPGGFLREMYEGLEVTSDLEFCEMSPDGFDHLIVGHERLLADLARSLHLVCTGNRDRGHVSPPKHYS